MIFIRAIALLGAALPLFAAEQVNLRILQAVAESYFAKQPAQGIPTGIAFEDALRAQRSYVQLLIPKLGPPVGHKVGFVTKAGQERYKIDHPVRGILLRDMLLPDKSTVSANYGTRPILEPDLVVRVKDESLIDATTMEEAAKHLSEIVAFIELADGIFNTNAPVDAGVVVSANVGARLGILGERRAFEPAKEFIEAFGKMKLVLKDETGQEISNVSAEGMLGHPMNPLLWFLKDMKKHGLKLKAGEYISLGSPSPQVVPQPGKTYTLIYEGLPGGPVKAQVTTR